MLLLNGFCLGNDKSTDYYYKNNLFSLFTGSRDFIFITQTTTTNYLAYFGKRNICITIKMYIGSVNNFYKLFININEYLIIYYKVIFIKDLKCIICIHI